MDRQAFASFVQREAEALEVKIARQLRKFGITESGETTTIRVTVSVIKNAPPPIFPIDPKVNPKANFSLSEPLDMGDVLLINRIAKICASVGACSIAQRVLEQNGNQPTRIPGNSYLAQINKRLASQLCVRLVRDKNGPYFQFWKTQ